MTVRDGDQYHAVVSQSTTYLTNEQGETVLRIESTLQDGTRLVEDQVMAANVVASEVRPSAPPMDIEADIEIPPGSSTAVAMGPATTESAEPYPPVIASPQDNIPMVAATSVTPVSSPPAVLPSSMGPMAIVTGSPQPPRVAVVTGPPQPPLAVVPMGRTTYHRRENNCVVCSLASLAVLACCVCCVLPGIAVAAVVSTASSDSFSFDDDMWTNDDV